MFFSNDSKAERTGSEGFRKILAYLAKSRLKMVTGILVA